MNAFHMTTVGTLLGLLASCAAIPQEPPAEPGAGLQLPRTDAAARSRTYGAAANLHFGRRSVNEDLMPDVDEHWLAGFSVDSHDPMSGRPFGYEIAGFVSSDTDASSSRELEGSLAELSFGLRRNFGLADLGRFVPFAGAGFAVVLAEREEIRGPGDFDAESTITPAAYAHGGAFYQFDGGYRAGLDVRWTFLTDRIDLGAGDAEASYLQLSFFVGWSF